MLAANYLKSGLYTVSDAARLIKVNPQRLRRWVTGDPHGDYGAPLIGTDIERIDGHVSLSFMNLIEALFIAKFAARGLHIRSIRAMANEAKRFLQTPYPFAKNVLFRADGQKIFAEIVKRTGDHELYDLSRRNWAFYTMLRSALKPAIVYGVSEQAERWYPRKRLAPNVIVNPIAAFGQPVLSDSGVPTRTIRRAVKAEGGDCATVAKWFDISVARVAEAVKFETRLDMAARRLRLMNTFHRK
jgi:uncharacterized protein (DUF433 family)